MHETPRKSEFILFVRIIRRYIVLYCIFPYDTIYSIKL